MSRISTLLFLACFLLFAAGCAHKPTLKPASIDERIATLLRSALNTDSPSEQTKIFLLQMELEERWKNEPLEVLAELDAEVRDTRDRDALFALSELAYLEAKREKAGSKEAVTLFLSCAVYSWRYLFDAAVTPPMMFYNPYARVVAMFYNRSMTEFLLYAKNNGIHYRQGLRFPLVAGELELVDKQDELDIPSEVAGTYYLSYTFKVEGLDPQMLESGIGVPLLIVRTPPQAGERSREQAFMAGFEQAYAATALLRFVPDDSGAVNPDAQGTYRADLEVYDPMKSEYAIIQGHKVPLEIDMTTPLAYTIEKAPTQSGFQGMLDPAAWAGTQGLYTLQPYQQGRIPVVFVHGLMSSPITWLPMLNLLMNDPVLRKRYQFWFFKYPTGNPTAYSASILRKSLQDAVRTFDPAGTDKALKHMLIVGHSMGGLLTKMMVMQGGDAIWNLYFDFPFDELDLPARDKELLERMFYFEPQPFVGRVVFMATPHRGSDLAVSAVGRIGVWLISLPLTILETASNVFTALAQASQGRQHGDDQESVREFERSFTGIGALSPQDKAMKYLAEQPLTAVPFHSIIGNRHAAGVAGGSDGIVPYSSAHLDGAESELILLSGHSVQQRPLAVREVRRIMLEHLASIDLLERPAAVQQAPQAGNTAGHVP